MKKDRQPAGFMAVLALMCALVLGPGFTGIAAAASEDVAIFYDDLSQYGQWAEYENYGPVWRPSQVQENWRPYTDGRWVPTDNGYVFESQEPWGWATYHYGNWMPTQGNGWVWVPGRTWYPSTVEWRTSPENTPPDDSYVGWAPIPPPNYEPPPDYAPPPSYSQGNPVVDALTAPFWIFAKAASFLLGLGQVYEPTYSYANTGVLVPPSYVQVFYPQTVIVRSYYTPLYYPATYFGGRRPPFAAYNWGPPPAYLYRNARINQAIFNRAVHNNSSYITRIHNVVPPSRVINRYGYIKQIMPPALAQGRALPPPRRVENYRMAQANLYKPNVLPAPRQVPPIKAQFHKLQPVAGFQPGHAVPPAPQTGPGRVTPGTPTAPVVHTEPGRVPPGRAVPGEFRPGPSRAAEPRATQPRPAPASPGYRPTMPEQRQQQERYQRQRQQEALRQGQQPRQQEVRKQQVQRQQQSQEVQRRRQQEVQSKQLRERQQQQYQRAQPQQVRPQPAPHPQAQAQPRPHPQQHQQQQRKQEQQKQEQRHRQPDEH